MSPPGTAVAPPPAAPVARPPRVDRTADPRRRRRRRGPRWSAERRRDLTFYGAIAASALLVAVAMLEIASRWRDERAAMRRALVSEVADAAFMLVDRMNAQRETAELLLMAPVHGMTSEANGVGLRLPGYLRYTERQLRGMALAGDSLHGVLRVDLRAPWPDGARLEALGAARDPAVAAAALAHLAARRGSAGADDGPIGRARLRVGPRMVELLTAVQVASDGAPVAIVGVTYDATYWKARMLPRLLASVPLLPPSFHGVDWTSAEWVSPGASGGRTRIIVGQQQLVHNAQLAVTLADATGRSLVRTPLVDRVTGADASGQSPYTVHVSSKGTPLRVSIPQAHGDRLVRAAVPIGAEQWLVGGVALLGALFVAAAIVELRRQHQLAEERRNFVSAVSHELRTPLAHVALLSETLLAPQPHTDEQRRRWLGVIHREALRLGRLVENVLLHARGEQRDLPLERRAVEVAEVAREVLLGLASAADARRVRLRLDAPAGCVAHADAGALRQILLNLVDNAIKHGPDAQTVTLGVACDGAADVVVLTVDDEGAGVPARDRRRVWEPFVRLGDRGGATGGSGLGLGVVRQLVALHGGRVDVQDAPTGGARFVVTLPAGRAG